MLLSEILDRIPEYSITRNSNGTFETVAVIGKSKIVFSGQQITRLWPVVIDGKTTEFKLLPVWDLAFAAMKSRDGKESEYPSFGLTKNGDSLQVFAFVMKSISDLIRLENPERMSFTADKIDKGRTELYTRLVNRYASKYRTWATDKDDSVKYMLEKK